MAVLAASGVLAVAGGFVADRVDPVPAQPTPISCSSPDHDRALTEETEANPVFELDRYAPALAAKLGLPGFDVPAIDPVCAQDRGNVVAKVREMLAKGELASRPSHSGNAG